MGGRRCVRTEQRGGRGRLAVLELTRGRSREEGDGAATGGERRTTCSGRCGTAADASERRSGSRRVGGEEAREALAGREGRSRGGASRGGTAPPLYCPLQVSTSSHTVAVIREGWKHELEDKVAVVRWGRRGKRKGKRDSSRTRVEIRRIGKRRKKRKKKSRGKRVGHVTNPWPLFIGQSRVGVRIVGFWPSYYQ